MENREPALSKDEYLDVINDGLSLVGKRTHLKFGTDALLLAGYLRRSRRAAELGAGNGAISLLAASRGKFSSVDGFELQPEAASLFERNIEKNNLGDRVRARCLDVRSLSSDPDFIGKYDCVFSNPPYMKADSGVACAAAEKQTARHETAGDIYDFCAAASALLKYGGEAVFVYRPDRLCDLLDAMRHSGIEPKRLTFVSSDAAHRPSMVLTAGKKGGAPGLFLSPFFFIEDGNGRKSADYDYLMKEGNFGERFYKP